jgi:pyridoxine 5-phosphate synthase
MSAPAVTSTVRLHVNIDHVATVRNARGTSYPCPVEAAVLCMATGADGITAHLREDRRHIRDEDVRRLRERVRGLFNLEMAATDEMVAIAIATKPDIVTLVPERREERTTEGGLDVIGGGAVLRGHVPRLFVTGLSPQLVRIKRLSTSYGPGSILEIRAFCLFLQSHIHTRTTSFSCG